MYVLGFLDAGFWCALVILCQIPPCISPASCDEGSCGVLGSHPHQNQDCDPKRFESKTRFEFVSGEMDMFEGSEIDSER